MSATMQVIDLETANLALLVCDVRNRLVHAYDIGERELSLSTYASVGVLSSLRKSSSGI